MNIISKKLIKGKLLYLVIVPLCCAVGYSIGYLNTSSYDKAITQETQSLSKVAVPKEKNATNISLIVKLSERQVHVYQGKQILNSFPIAVGKLGWETPLGKYQVIRMRQDPVFKNFKTGELIKPSPKNPLGKRLIVFKRGEKFDFAIHGTNQNELIGQAVSHGCIRMYNKDVIKLYEMIDIGTPVSILP